MPTRVITPPAPYVTPAAIPGPHAANDARVAQKIAAAIEDIDGPDGYARRCFGPQTLEWTGDGFGRNARIRLYGPVIEIDAVTYRDAAGGEQTFAPENYGYSAEALWLKRGAVWPETSGEPGMVTVRYQAGCDGANTGPIPARAKEAVIVIAQHLMMTGSGSMFLRSDTVEGVGAKTFMDGDKAGAMVAATVERLLSRLKVPWV